MPRFIVLGHEAPVSPGINLEDLPGSAGRLDVLCRCVTAGLLHSHGIRSASEVITVHQDAVTVRFDGSSIRQLHPDERSTAARFDAALEAATDAVGLRAVEASPGVTVSKHDLSALLDDVDDPVVQLRSDGEPLTDWSPDPDATFVLSDHRRFDEADQTVLSDVVDRRLSIGPKAIHADQAITVMHNYLDTDGYRTY